MTRKTHGGAAIPVVLLDSSGNPVDTLTSAEVNWVVGGLAENPTPATWLTDSPNDGLMYGRQSLGWARSVAVAGDTMTGALKVADADPDLYVNLVYDGIGFSRASGNPSVVSYIKRVSLGLDYNADSFGHMFMVGTVDKFKVDSLYTTSYVPFCMGDVSNIPAHRIYLTENSGATLPFMVIKQAGAGEVDLLQGTNRALGVTFALTHEGNIELGHDRATSSVGFYGTTSTTAGVAQSSIVSSWADSTHATREGQLVLRVSNYVDDHDVLALTSSGTSTTLPITLSDDGLAPTDAWVNIGQLAGSEIGIKTTALNSNTAYHAQFGGLLQVREQYPVFSSFAAIGDWTNNSYALLYVGKEGSGIKIPIAINPHPSVSTALSVHTRTGGAFDSANISFKITSAGDIELGHDRATSSVGFYGTTSTTAGVAQSSIVSSWADSTHATRAGKLVFNIDDYLGTNNVLQLDNEFLTLTDINTIKTTTNPLEIHHAGTWELNFRTIGSTMNFQLLGSGGTPILPLGIDAENVNIGRGNVSIIGSDRVGIATFPARLYVKGVGNTSATTALIIENSDSTKMLEIINDQTIGLFGTTPVAQQAGGAATAGAAYTATEQTMLQAVYDAVRAIGIMA